MSQQIDRFGKCAILNLNVEGFDKLPLEKKHLVYHLSMSGLYGRDLFLQQNYKHNLTVKNVLETMYQTIQAVDTTNLNLEIFGRFSQYLKEFWLHVGIYDCFSNKRLDVHFTEVEFNYLLSYTEFNLSDEDLSLVRSVLFDSEFTKLYKNIQADGVDVVAESGGNFYDNLTSAEVDLYRSVKYPKINNAPQFGFNSRLTKVRLEEEVTESHELYENSLNYLISEFNSKNETELSVENDSHVVILEEKISEEGLYGEYVKNIVKHLEMASEYTENKEQKLAILTLVDFYKSGKPEDFDVHSLAWVKDQESEIFFINGLIESYDDPKGVGCTFESVVAFKNPEQTEKVNQIIKNIQWFENNMPVSPRFKKDKASGLSASSVTVAGMAGATSPTLPLGICLPNSDWIRAQHGSKSVNLANVHNARGESEGDLKSEFFLDQYQDMVKEHISTSTSLHTDLHEVAGHGSCQSLAGVSNEDLDIYYSVIEEARADLVGLYFINRPELVEFGVLEEGINLEEFGIAQYVHYLTNGSMLQLRRVELGATLAQPHLRNRQLISNWLLEQATKSKCAEQVTDNGKTYIVVNDFDKCRELLGELLGEIQRIKSTGDFEAAKAIVEQYGTQVDYDLHSQILERVESINPPSLYGFTTPIYTEVKDDSGNVIDYEVHQKDNFIEDQLYLSKHFS